MPRQLRLQYEGAVYHVMNRGDRREAIFGDDEDRKRFLTTIEEACAKTGWHIHAYCLMPNHFHLVVETPRANLVAGMKWLLGTYSSRFNRRHKLSGHVFAGRYKSLVVDHHHHGYLRTVCEYVHLNPVRAKLVAPNHPLRDFRWSSFNDYLGSPNRRPRWLRVDRLFGEMRIAQDSAAGRREFEHQIETRRQAESGHALREIRRAWCLGNSVFREKLLAEVAEQSGPNHYAEPRRESEQERAERCVQEELRQLGWQEQDLLARRKGDPVKVRIARRLRRETAVGLKWIADRLRMGAWTQVSNRLREEPLVRQQKRRPRSAPRLAPSTEVQMVRTDPYIESLPTHCL